MSSSFCKAFAVLIGEEGGFSCDPSDPGNWTGGKVGVGKLNGTKFGISAAAYPTLDIENLTLERCQEQYKNDYWDRVRGDDLAPSLALLAFDAAVNNGVERSVRWLQMAAGVTADGVIGPQTLAAVTRRGAQAMCVEFMAQRVAFMGSLPTWKTFGLGWSRRLCALPWKAMQMEAA